MKRERAAYLNAKLIEAIRREDVEGVRNWLNEGASPNGRRRSAIARFIWGSEASPLIEAILVDSVPIVKLLLQSGADTHEKQILETACYRGSLEIVQTLVSAGLHPGPSELMMAVEYNQVHAAEYLLKSGVGIDERLLGHLDAQWWRKPAGVLELLEKYGFEYKDEMKAHVASRDKYIKESD